MSGHHPFSELTKDFTLERWQRVAAMRAELERTEHVLLDYVFPSEKKKSASTVLFCRTDQRPLLQKTRSRSYRYSVPWTLPTATPITRRNFFSIGSAGLKKSLVTNTT